MFTIALSKGLPAAHESDFAGGSNVYLDVCNGDGAGNSHLTGNGARVLVQG